MREQFGMRRKQLAHFGAGTEMILPVQPLLRMLLAKQSKSADALDNVVFPSVGRQVVVNRERSNAGQGRGPFVKGIEAVYIQVKPIGKELGQFGVGAQSQKTLGVRRD